MTTEERDPTTLALELGAASARARVAEDVEELAEQLRPEQLKNRALDAAEHSIASLLKRAVARLKAEPRLALAYARRHPVASVVAASVAAALVWRVAHGRR
jgi:hypothetical protein